MVACLLGSWRVRPGGFEPPTNSLKGCCSIHLSYWRALVRQQLTAQCFIALPNSATSSAKLNASLPRGAGLRAAPSRPACAGPRDTRATSQHTLVCTLDLRSERLLEGFL